MPAIRISATPDEVAGLDVVIVVPYVCDDGEQGEVSAVLAPDQARALGMALIAKVDAIRRAEARSDAVAVQLLDKFKQQEGKA
ncbi:hypothetical protein [Zoogloea sp. 1C4]|uniref:hypothetical protein n=1 Tax=Zoogloea sp. 1C4 TaxID=2570190 RepID=UPI001292A396|nr:hypothetical protein [Zoogloea sp. 1C4]